MNQNQTAAGHGAKNQGTDHKLDDESVRIIYEKFDRGTADEIIAAAQEFFKHDGKVPRTRMRNFIADRELENLIAASR